MKIEYLSFLFILIAMCCKGNESALPSLRSKNLWNELLIYMMVHHLMRQLMCDRGR